MRTLIKGYTFTAGTRIIDCSNSNVFDIENIRLIVNETQKIVICSSMQKDLIASIIDGVITYAETLPVLVSGDKLTIEIDKGENYPNSIAVLSEMVEAKKVIADAIILKGGVASEVASFAELSGNINDIPNFNSYGITWQAGYEPTSAIEVFNNKRLYLTEVNNTIVQNVVDYAFCYCTNLTSVSLPVVQTIGISVFQNCTNLTSVSLPVAQSIGNSAFTSCTYLTSVSLPAVQTIGTSVFQYCTYLTSVSLPVAQILGNSVFHTCQNLSEISLPAAQTIGTSVFQNCTNLTSVSLPAVQTIGTSVFQSCINLTSVSLPAALTIGNSAFQYCTNLTAISLPAAQIIGTTAFSTCPNLTSVSFGKLTSFASTNTFAGCSMLSNIIIGAETNINLDFSSLSHATWNTNINATIWNENFVSGIINNLFDFTSGVARTIKCGAFPYAKLTSQTIALATAKNWNITT